MLRKLTFFIFINTFLLSALWAQKHDRFLLFGYHNNSSDLHLGGAVVDYDLKPPVIHKKKRKIDLDFYCGICSDSSGNLAFYTNGISIRDTSDNIMMNGDTINPGPVWDYWQGESYPNGPFCFALPAPIGNNQYYFFHMGNNDSPSTTSPFYYSVINMNKNNGLGMVIQKNKTILPGFTEHNYIAPVAVKHGNGRDWWVITGEVSSPKIFVFLLDHEGVHGPFETEMTYTFDGKEYQSINAVSPDGRTYVRCDGNHGLYIYDFDRCSGILDNLRILPFGDPNFFGFASVFAPDSRHLYLSSWDALAVLDLEASDISASFDTLAYFDGKASPNEPFLTGFWIPNLAPNGKIYYATTNSTLSLHVINNPNFDGDAADIAQHGVDLPKYNAGTMCLYPNYRLGRWTGSPCDTLPVHRPGFNASDWYPSSKRMLDTYKVLPPIKRKQDSLDIKNYNLYRPSIAELARRLLKVRKEQQIDKQIPAENRQ